MIVIDSDDLALWAMAIAAGIIGDAGCATVVTNVDVPAKPWCSARLDCFHGASFAAANTTGVVASVGSTMPPKYVGNLEGGAHRLRSGRRHL